MLTLQTDGEGTQSKNGKNTLYRVYHPVSLRLISMWVPNKLVRHLSIGQIKIPRWLWEQKQ